MISALLERAHQLIELKRYAEAAKELRMVLSQDPNSPEALALFAICESELGKTDEAIRLIQQAIRQQPDNHHYLYLLALFYFNQQNYAESEKTIRNAIAFEPHSADYFGLLATIKINQRAWNDALELANKGLECDPDNLQCLNMRSQALFKLDKKDDAFATVREALNQDPENELTHTNIGWSLLEQGDHKQALEHFREALKINPHSQYAKAGLVEGLKARYLFYRLFLKYAFWLSNMSSKGQWVIILGMYFGVRILRGIASTNETLSLILTPIIYLYFVFAFSTWVIVPLSNLFLRLNVYGRYALTKEETRSSNFVGVSLALGLLGGLVYLVNPDMLYLMVLIYGVSMMVPLASMYEGKKPSSKKILMGYAIFQGLVGAGAIVLYAMTGVESILITIYLIGLVAYQFVGNALIMR